MILSIYDALIRALAAAGAASLGLITLLVGYDVLARNLGFPTLRWTSAVVEYVLLFSTMAAAPFLVRSGGHVAVTAFVDSLPDGLRRLTGRAMLVVSVVTLSVLAWVAGAMTWQRLGTGATDIRSVAIPAWILYAMLSAGFALMAVEFLRLLLRGEVYSGGEGAH